MTEKRFKLDFDNCREGCIMDREDKYGQYKRLYDFGKVGRHQIVALMNNLNEENRQLKALLKEAEDEIKTLKQNNKGLLESLVEHESED